MNPRLGFVMAMALVSAPVLATLPPEDIARLPPPSTAKVDFVRDIKPIFDSACVKCHGKGKSKGDFSIETREQFMKGGEAGPAVIAGRSAESYLIELVSGLNPDSVMPQKGSKLTAGQVSLLRAWIDQGVEWPAEVSFGKATLHNLHPRKPALPEGPKVTHPVDRLLAPYFAAHRVSLSPPIEDRVFARRAYLDVIGLLPSPKELNAFLADTRADKRERLVTRLLADNRRYAEHWLTFWNDRLRNDYRGTGYIDGGRKQISAWLFSALLTNMPYDRLVAQLVNPTPESEGFINGIVWRGAVNASQTPPMQAAQSIGQVFLGVNLKCASCHDSFINDYTLADAYGLASVYATNEVEMFECDKPTGRKAMVKFLYPELGEIDPALPRPERTEQLARILTARENGRLTRTVVNRLWAELTGRGLVEPVDEMDQPAWNPDLLDWLAEDFAENGYDLKRTIKWILTSRAYQAEAVNLDEQPGKSYVFTGPAIRRMTAEQFRDAVGSVTDVWYERPSGKFSFSDGTRTRLPEAARWIWSATNAAQKAPAESIHLRKRFSLPAVPEQAVAAIACDNSFTLYVNGKQVTSGKDFQQPGFVDLRPHLKAGHNVIAVIAVNHTRENKPPRPEESANEGDANPAGFIFAARLRGTTISEIVSDASWRWSRDREDGWEKPGFEDGAWSAVADLGSANLAPWKLAAKLDDAMSLGDVHGTVRASLVSADPLMVALGRPNREQIITTRSSTATTLQGLEMTNGETLNAVLKRGAEKLLADSRRPTRELVGELFLKSLGRPATQGELALSADLVGSPARREGVEDLLWSMAMLPEFQLIY